MAGKWRHFALGYWVALQRSAKDQRARKAAAMVTLRLAFVLVYVLGLGYALFVWIPSESNSGTAVATYGLLAISVSVMILIIRRSRRPEHLILGDALRVPRKAQPVAPEVRAYLRERATIFAALVVRAAGEAFAQEQSARSEVALGMRQVNNTLLREFGLWERLEPMECGLFSASPESWTENQRSHIGLWCEQLRLLRWVLGLDGLIEPLASFPEPDLALSQGLLALPPDGTTRESWEARVERDLAAVYVGRLLAEQHHRGLNLQPMEEEQANWVKDLREKHEGASTDLLAGSKTVGELDNDTLLLFASIVLSRWRYACYLVELLNSDRPFTFDTWTSGAALNGEGRVAATGDQL